MLLSYITWTASPVAFKIPTFFWDDLEVRWYGIAFVVGFTLGLWIVGKIWKHEKLNIEWFDTLFFYVIFATVIGSRLGHCLFYNPGYYLANPLEIFKIWEGGLASHGGTLGIIIAIWIYSKRVSHKSMLWTFDRLVVPVGFVAALIRLGNLMNHEIYGHETNVSWAFKFIENVPSWLHGYAPIYSHPSHPTQLYEAFFYILTACICLWMYWKREDYKYNGLIFGVFLIGIFLSRFFVEFCKNNQEEFEEGMFLNMGQLLSIPFIIAGFWFMFKGLKEKSRAKAVGTVQDIHHPTVKKIVKKKNLKKK
ncbi:prolipoprotein diacylglyceryl transferase [Bacteroidia bacterium]|nr:prolipoprotein diacylglyceryl transferase [Bacteroidia bacterium]